MTLDFDHVSTSPAASSVEYSGAVEQYSLYLVDRGRLSKGVVGWSRGSTKTVDWAVGGSMTGALEVVDFPEPTDELSLPVAADRGGVRSRMSLSRIVGARGGCSSRRGLVRSLASVSVHSESEIGE